MFADGEVWICPNLTSSQKTSSRNYFWTEVVGCAHARNDSYANDIDCKWTHHTEMPEFFVLVKQVSTYFDPDIYTDVKKFQLYHEITQ